MRRRDFLKNIALGSLVLNVDPGLWAQGSSAPDLAVVHGESPGLIAEEAVKALGGMKKFISRGDEVVVKPNIGWDRRPEQAACTNPEIVKTIVKMCFDSGAKKVKVLDNPCNPAQRTYMRSGIAAAAKEAGAEVPYPNEHKLKKMNIKGEWLTEWDVFSEFVEADKIVNLPIAKTHSLSKLTMGMKNWLGAIGGNRNQLHQKIDLAMIDLSAFFKPCLTVLDGYRLLMRNGPQGGRLSDVKLYKTVAAGVDYVAVDTVGASFFDMKPEELAFLKLAEEKGYGETNLERLNIEKRTI